MARAYPHLDYLEDSSIGLSGGRLECPWIIEIDNVGDDPYTPWLAACPFNSDLRSIRTVSTSIARRFVGMVSVEYGFPKLLNEKTYRGIVSYGPTSDRVIGQWRRSVRFASETKPFTWSLPEKKGDPSFRVATRDYDIASPQSAGIYTATITEKSDAGAYVTGPKNLIRTGFFNDASLASNDGITSIVYDIFMPQLSGKQVRDLSSLKWHTNSIDFLGYPTWTLIFANWECHDEVMTLPGSRPIVQWYTNLSVELLYKEIDVQESPFGWRGIILYDTFSPSGAGRGVPVYLNGTQVSQRFVQYPEINFANLFGVINYGVPAN